MNVLGKSVFFGGGVRVRLPCFVDFERDQCIIQAPLLPGALALTHSLFKLNFDFVL